MIINDLYNNNTPTLTEGMKPRDLAMYCEKLVAEKGLDAAYKHVMMMANVGRDPAWNSVLKYLDAMKQGMSEGRMVKGPGGVPLDRQGRPVPPKVKPIRMQKWLVTHSGSHGEGGKDIIEAPNAETAWELANEYDLDIINVKPYRGPARPTLVDEGVAEGADTSWIPDVVKLLGKLVASSKAQAKYNVEPADIPDVKEFINSLSAGNLDAARDQWEMMEWNDLDNALEYFVRKNGLPHVWLHKLLGQQGVAEGSLDEDKGMKQYWAFKREWRAKHGANAKVPGYDSREYTAWQWRQADKQQGVAEVSDKTLVNYLHKVSDDSLKHDQDPSKRSAEKRNRSVTGFARAFNKLDGRKPDGSIKEASLGDYRKKAALSKATSQMDRFFGRDDPARVAQADQTIAKRERGMARADTRVKPYTAPPVDLEKRQRDLTAKYPNIDELVRRAELNRDPNYEMADGQAYYNGREAEQNYLKLKQIQRVIQGLNESLQRTQP